MKTITADDGTKFELFTDYDGKVYNLRPLQSEKKLTVTRHYEAIDDSLTIKVKIQPQPTSQQAQALSDAIQALVTWLQDSDGETVRALADGTLLDVYCAMNTAHQALQENK